MTEASVQEASKSLSTLIKAAKALSMSGFTRPDLSARAPNQEAIYVAAQELGARVEARIRIQGGAALETFFSLFALVEGVLVSLYFSRPSTACDEEMRGWLVDHDRPATREEVRAAVGVKSSALRPIEASDVVGWTL